MRKFTDFIVNKRYIVLISFIIFSIISAIASRNVNINYDMANYLPSSSETRIGIDIMEDKFKSIETSSLNLMFKGLPEEEKTQVYDDLSNINGVDSVDYDDSEDYNKDDYTLYVITVDANEDSELATEVYEEIIEKYENYEIYTSGEVAERNKPVLATWIVGLAIGCALIILIIMCESYVEPFLFLTAILMAVLLNKGTNIMFSSVSNITDSIAAILQLALSMDYSIMLMSRYDQEKKRESDNIEAMKKALYNAFKSISSSSITTIVGLIALVFMSFTIGRDLGFVLAKGVLFSLVSIFFVLPALILIFNKAIEKTKKKSPNIRLDKLGKFSYRFRYISIFLFIGIFAISYFLKGNLGILYTNSEEDEISDVFAENNQIAIIYKSEDEEKIAGYLDELEKENKISEVLGYGNTINEKLTYEELNEQLDDLGADVDIESYLLKILYYNYYNQSEDNKMTFDEFVTFIQTEVYANEDLGDELDDEVRDDIDRLKNFTTDTLINQQRTSTEIASILEINEDKIKDILVYYNSKNNNLKISIGDFINFMNNDVLTNEKYGSSVDANNRNNLNTLSKFISTSTIDKKMSAQEMANLFGMPESVMCDLYKYYISVNEIDTKMTIAEFSNFVLTDVLNNPQYASSFDETTINNIKLLNTFSNNGVITTEMNPIEIANLFGLDEKVVSQLLFFKYSTVDSGRTLGLAEFINNVMNIKNNTNYLADRDLSSLEQLYVFSKNENNINTTKMDKNTLATMFNGIRTGFVENIYLLAGLPDDYMMTPQEFITLVLTNLDNSHGASLDESVFTVDEGTLNNLRLLKLVIDDSVSENPTQYTAGQLSKLLNMDAGQMYQLYALIDLTQNNTSNWKITPNDFVNLILANSSNPNIAGNIDEATMNKLNLVSNVMNSSLNNTSYTYNELAGFIGIDAGSVKNIYTLYTANISNVQLTPQEFVNFVLAHKDDSTLSSNLNAETVSNLQLVQSVMDGVKVNKQYTSLELSGLLGLNKEDLDLLYGLYITKHVNINQTMSLKEFVEFLLDDVMTNKDYSDNFDEDTRSKLSTINGIMNSTLNNTEYTKDEIFAILTTLTDSLDKNTVDLLYVYYGSSQEYDENWRLTVEEFINYLNDTILNDSRFDDFIEDDMRQDILEAKDSIKDAKELLIGDGYSRIVLNTKFDLESEETFAFIQKLKDLLGENIDEFYVIGDSPMAYEMSQTFNNELNFITILTMIAIFVVVAVTFKSVIVPFILVLTIQCAVYLTMGILSLSGGSVYFIALLIVQSILMGATIDYAILYTSYYIEHRKTMGIKEAIINSYNKSIHTILTSASILVIVTLIVGHFASAIAAKICTTISQGTLCSTLLILLLLPAVIAACDKIVLRRQKNMKT